MTSFYLNPPLFPLFSPLHFMPFLGWPGWYQIDAVALIGRLPTILQLGLDATATETDGYFGNNFSML
jgi:hypothetical protein